MHEKKYHSLIAPPYVRDRTLCRNINNLSRIHPPNFKWRAGGGLPTEHGPVNTQKNQTFISQFPDEMEKIRANNPIYCCMPAHTRTRARAGGAGGLYIPVTMLRKQNQNKLMGLDSKHVRTYTHASSPPSLPIWDGCLLRRDLRSSIWSPAAAEVILST